VIVTDVLHDRPVFLRAFRRARSRSQILNCGHSYPMGGIGEFAVRKQNVEADRKGQRGQQAQHGATVDLGGLKCA